MAIPYLSTRGMDAGPGLATRPRVKAGSCGAEVMGSIYSIGAISMMTSVKSAPNSER
jgi:hypothetical protein